MSEWDSAEALDTARADPEWRATVQRFVDDPDLHVTARPAVYQLAVDVHPGNASNPDRRATPRPQGGGVQAAP